MKKKLVAAVAVLSALTFVSSASAGFQVHPANLCRQVSGGTPTLFYSALGNSGTTPMSVDCPIVRPSGTSFTAMSAYTGSNWVVSGFQCTLLAIEFSGSMSNGSVWSSGPKYVNGANGSPSSTVFDNPVNPSTYAHAYMNCTIPPKTSGGNISYLVSYKPYIN